MREKTETPTGWYFAGDGTIVIPASACQHCGHGPDEDGTELHYFGCPASGEDDSVSERYAGEGDNFPEPCYCRRCVVHDDPGGCLNKPKEKGCI